MPAAVHPVPHRPPAGTTLRRGRLAAVVAAALATALAAVLTATAGPAAAAELSRRGEVVEVRGEVRAGDGAAFAALLDERVNLVRVRLSGGDAEATLEIAEALRQRGLALSVDGLCVAACAQFLLPAANGLSIAEGSLVVMQAGGHGTWRAALREGALAGEGFAATRGFVEQAEARFAAHARAVKLVPEALEFMYALTAGRQVRLSLATGTDGSPRVRMDGARDAPCRGWLLDGPALEALGIEAHGWTLPNLALAAVRLGLPVGSLYLGPPLPAEALAEARTCGDVRDLRDAQAQKR